MGIFGSRKLLVPLCESAKRRRKRVSKDSVRGTKDSEAEAVLLASGAREKEAAQRTDSSATAAPSPPSAVPCTVPSERW